MRKHAHTLLHALLLTATLTACDDGRILEPALLEPGSRQPQRAADGPRPVPSSIRYREPAHQHATGRAGSATLAARALLGVDGRVTLELTTGRFDLPGAPGRIEKVQWKALSATGAVLSTRNESDFAPAATPSFPLGPLPRTASVQVQANIRGVDRNRTGVVTVTEPVRRRPDLAITKLAHPEKVTVGTPVVIDVTVEELNGDLAASADCILEIDGAEVARSRNIWVAEGDAVSCRFERAFAAPGRHALRARLADVRPGDWNEANNSRGSSLEIVAAAPPASRMTGLASVWDNRYHWYQKYEGIFTPSDESTRFFFEQDWFVEYQDALFMSNNVFPRDAAFDPRNPRIEALEVVQSVDGKTIDRLDLTDFTNRSLEGAVVPQNGVCDHYDSGYGWAIFCLDDDQAIVLAGHWAQQTTYFTNELASDWYGDYQYGESVYVRHERVQRGFGSWGPSVRDSYGFQVRARFAGRELSASPVVRVQASAWMPLEGASYPRECTAFENGGHSCFELSVKHQLVAGRTDF